LMKSRYAGVPPATKRAPAVLKSQQAETAW
jgi:hypothetical protein